MRQSHLKKENNNNNNDISFGSLLISSNKELVLFSIVKCLLLFDMKH